MIRVELEPWEYEWASHVGARRFIENWGKKDASYYDKGRMEDDRTASVAAAICELAVAKHTNKYWSGHVWSKSDHNKYKHTSDVGANIEVRRVRTGDTARVNKSQVGKGLWLFVVRAIAPEFRAVDILGYIDYDEAWDKGLPSPYDDSGNTRVIESKYLKEKK